MYFNKYPYRSNFEFPTPAVAGGDGEAAWRASFEATDFRPRETPSRPRQTIELSCRAYADDVYCLSFASPRWPRNYAQSELVWPALATGEGGRTCLSFDGSRGLVLADERGQVVLESIPERAFGVCGNASIFHFRRDPGQQFYGMGEKLLGFELSEKQTKFWNTDVFADFHPKVFTADRPDPMYVSVPYLIIKRGNSYVGLLLDNPYATFMSTRGRVSIAGQMEADQPPQAAITLGAEHGQPNLVIIYGPSLAELTRKLQRLVGVTPLPPAWALGYHQCRWGYGSFNDLRYLEAAMDKYEIPCDALWLDIDYMRGYRVFTFDPQRFAEPKRQLAAIQASGRRVVPIIDPGVKAEAGYEVYESGQAAGAFCLNPQGGEFVGLVWPGETVFPDFSTVAGRDWWAGWVRRFADTGITAAWLDMNDPATGDARCTDMLFDAGRDSHYTFHNQYGMGMARASRAGFQAAYPDDRPFLLCRSGFTGSSKYTAIWTGDNVSNYHYLKESLPCSMNLALSGIPFNGPDAGGFAGSTTPGLIVDWFKAGFLFPFFRNHCIAGAEQQEPWVFDHATFETLRHYIRLRYKLRPYLYNLFVDQEESGEAILRPLLYDFEDNEELPLGRIADQFMVGPAIMQAPFLAAEESSRQVVLPGERGWYSPTAEVAGRWLAGGARTVEVGRQAQATPLFVREGTIVPMSTSAPGEHAFVANQVELHLFASRQTEMAMAYSYAYDDGQSYGYRRGQRSRLRVTACVRSLPAAVDGRPRARLEIATELVEDGFGPCQVSWVLYDPFDEVTVDGQPVVPKPHAWQFVGTRQDCFRVD